MNSPQSERPSLAFIGGTGPEGRGLSLRFAALGYPVAIGSRSSERAQEAAVSLQELVPTARVTGKVNAEAATSDIIFLTIPYAGLEDTLRMFQDEARGKIVVSTIAPIEFREGRPVAIRVEVGSAAQEVQSLLPESRVVSAFQTIDAHQLQDLHETLDTDVVVCSDDVEARRTVLQMANELPGVRGLSGGRLGASHYVETCTALLITINRIYKVHSGLRLTGINR